MVLFKRCMFIWEVELVTVLFWELFGARVDCSLGFFLLKFSMEILNWQTGLTPEHHRAADVTR